MTLIERQNAFSALVAKLIQYAQSQSYMVTLGEAWRPQQMANYYASIGKGIQHSLHTQRLAIDLNLFEGTVLLSTVDDYRAIGEWWVSQSTPELPLFWGGHFTHSDADHFSCSNGEDQTE